MPTYRQIPIITQGPTVRGKLRTTTEATLASVLEAMEGHRVECRRYHEGPRPLVGWLTEGRRLGPCIVANLKLAPECPEEAAEAIRICWARIPAALGLSIMPEDVTTAPDGGIMVHALKSVDLVEYPAANPGGLAMPTVRQIIQQHERAAWEYLEWMRMRDTGDRAS